MIFINLSWEGLHGSLGYQTSHPQSDAHKHASLPGDFSKLARPHGVSWLPPVLHLPTHDLPSCVPFGPSPPLTPSMPEHSPALAGGRGSGGIRPPCGCHSWSPAPRKPTRGAYLPGARLEPGAPQSGALLPAPGSRATASPCSPSASGGDAGEAAAVGERVAAARGGGARARQRPEHVPRSRSRSWKRRAGTDSSSCSAPAGSSGQGLGRRTRAPTDSWCSGRRGS